MAVEIGKFSFFFPVLKSLTGDHIPYDIIALNLTFSDFHIF